MRLYLDDRSLFLSPSFSTYYAPKRVHRLRNSLLLICHFLVLCWNLYTIYNNFILSFWGFLVCCCLIILQSYLLSSWWVLNLTILHCFASFLFIFLLSSILSRAIILCRNFDFFPNWFLLLLYKRFRSNDSWDCWIFRGRLL